MGPFGTKCQSVSILYVEQSVFRAERIHSRLYQLLYVSYSDKHIRYRKSLCLCKCEGHLLEWNGRIGE